MRTPRLLVAAASATALVLSLAACGGDSSADDDARGFGTPRAAEAFPVTIEHAFGETTIESKPERVADGRLGQPRGAAGARRRAGRHEQGDLGRRRRRRRAAVGRGRSSRSSAPRRPCSSTRPTASTSRPSPTPQPDVILAAYSGLTQEEYDTLSKIAPVVAYPERGLGHVVART